MALADNVSLVVPTYKRSHFLHRFIGTMMKLEFGGHLILADSSPPGEFEKTEDVLSRLNPPFPVKHLSVPKEPGSSVSLSLNQAISAGAEQVETDYGMLTCDDDIPVPFTINQCQKVLDTSPHLASAVGDYPFVYLDDETNGLPSDYKPFLTQLELIPSGFMIQETAAERLDHYVNFFYHTMFMVTRREHLRRVVPDIAYTINFPHFSADYLWMFTLALIGPSVYIKAPHVIRQRHNNNLAYQHPYQKLSEALLEPTWPEDSRLFVKYVADLIEELDGVSPEEAHDAALAGFARVIGTRLAGSVNWQNLNSEFYKSRCAQYLDTMSVERKLFELTVSAMMSFEVESRVA